MTTNRRTVRLPFALVLLAALAAPGAAAVPSPTIVGPITGPGPSFVAATTFDLASVGYMQEEFFISGTATAFLPTGALGSDGRWSVTPASTAPYETRILVYRPIDRQQFKGTVVVEWLNVSGGLDSAPDWITAHTEMIRRGMAWVGVTAQIIGVEGRPVIGGLNLGLKVVNPARYAPLEHPGDTFSYDMFSQAGQALRAPNGPSPLGDLKIRKVIAVGESQSAFRLTTYIDAIHPLARVYDGFLVHSRGAGTPPISEAPQPVTPMPGTVFIRDDLDEPVLIFETETDVALLGYASQRQPDAARIRTWEIAGTAHADVYTLLSGMTDTGKSPAVADLIITSAPIPGIIMCGSPINDGPQHWVLDAAVAALDRWVRRHGAPAPRSPRIELANNQVVRDVHGNALGGIRTPELDVPIATYSGLGQTGSAFCFLFGTTTPFDPATLDALYPSHRAYVEAFDAATNRAVRSGFIQKVDASLLRQSAAGSSVGQ